MAKYRPVDLRLWDDRKFLALPDDVRLLWLFLLTTPSTLPIPGVIVAGEAALAEQLGWPVERFRERFRELTQSGIAVRAEGRVVWLPNALRYQPPPNPNTVKCWAKSWDDIPEVPMKHDLWQALKIACKSWGRIFEKMFAEPRSIGTVPGTVNGSRNGSGNGSTQDQEQKQDQDQERKSRSLSQLETSPATEPPGDHVAVSSYDPTDLVAKGRLCRSTYDRLSAARVQVAGELGKSAVPFPLLTPSTKPLGYRDLMERIAEEGARAPEVCSAIVDELIRQARDRRSIEWLAEKSFGEKPWRNVRNAIGQDGAIGGEDRKGPRSSEPTRYQAPARDDEDWPEFGTNSVPSILEVGGGS